jgi:transposase InsO family protein
MIGPLPLLEGKDAILVVVDRFSKIIWLIAMDTTLTSKQLAEIYWDHIWKHHRVPWTIISNRGPQFASQFIKELCKAVGTKCTLSMVYHPQTDGQMKRINQEVEGFLCKYVNFRQDNWARWIVIAEFQYNDKQHSTTRHTPFFLNYGRHP